MSSKQSNYNRRITEEINLIPEAKRQELYELIHNFRISLKQENKAKKIMEFAGSWVDLSELNLDDFCAEIEQRRQATSSRRFED